MKEFKTQTKSNALKLVSNKNTIFSKIKFLSSPDLNNSHRTLSKIGITDLVKE